MLDQLGIRLMLPVCIMVMVMVTGSIGIGTGGPALVGWLYVAFIGLDVARGGRAADGGYTDAVVHGMVLLV